MSSRNEMSQRVYTFDWAQTSLGPMASWSPSLKTAVQIMLESPFPNIVLWGPDLIQIYNDGYRVLMGNKHPAGLGQHTRECWTEVWHITEPIYRRVFDGEAAFFEDALFSINRDGVLTDAWFTLSYSPIRDEADVVAGVQVTVFETTRRLQAEIASREAEEKHRMLLDSLDEGYCIVEVLFDTQGKAVDYRFLETNSAFVRQTGLENAIGKTMRELAPTQEEFWFEIYGHIARTGEAIRFEHEAAALGKFYDVYAFRIEKPPADRVAILFIDIGDRKRGEHALRDSEERLRLFVTASSDIMYRMSPDWSRMYSLEGKEFLSDTKNPSLTWLEEYIPESDKAVTQATIDGAVRTKTTFELEHRVIRADGTIGWVFSRAVPLLNEQGEIIEWFGAAGEITERKATQAAIQNALESVEESNENLERRVEERTEQLAEMSEMRQELLRRVVTAQEEEASRISRDLHDDTGQQITGLLLGLDNLKKRPTVAADLEAQAILSHMQELAGDVARKSHRLSFTLRPTALDDMGLIAALRNYTETWCAWSGLVVEVENVGMEGGRLPKEIETTIYRVAQEALTNILKYASRTGSRVSIVVQRKETEVLTIIEDDGPGFDVEAVLSRPPGERRLGIFGMQERARLVGGMLDIESAPGEGTTIFLRIPTA